MSHDAELDFVLCRNKVAQHALQGRLLLSIYYQSMQEASHMR